MSSLGPVPMSVVLLLTGLGIAAIVARLLARSSPGWAATATFVDMLLLGLVAGRLAFVLQWWPQYAQDPLAVFRLGDGGYIAWIAIPCGLALGAWRARRNPDLRLPLLWGSVAGLVAWGLFAGAVALMQRSVVTLPDVDLVRLDGGKANLAAMVGRPLVLNLWATWCPPCRREMPVLAEAQATSTAVDFVFANQGEGPEQVRDYLRGTATLRNVLIDPGWLVSRATGARGLPTTLFFDAQGRLVDVHVGELTRGSLAGKLERLAPSQP